MRSCRATETTIPSVSGGRSRRLGVIQWPTTRAPNIWPPEASPVARAGPASRRRRRADGSGYTAVARAAGDQLAGHGERLGGGLSSTAEHRIVAPKVTGSKPVGHPNSPTRCPCRTTPVARGVAADGRAGGPRGRPLDPAGVPPKAPDAPDGRATPRWTEATRRCCANLATAEARYATARFDPVLQKDVSGAATRPLSLTHAGYHSPSPKQASRRRPRQTGRGNRVGERCRVRVARGAGGLDRPLAPLPRWTRSSREDAGPERHAIERSLDRYVAASDAIARHVDDLLRGATPTRRR
jgi:hypothetical protein